MRVHSALIFTAFIPATIVVVSPVFAEQETFTVSAGIIDTAGSLVLESSPGIPFSIDYDALLSTHNPPYQLVALSILFSLPRREYDRLHMKLDGGPEIYSFDTLDLDSSTIVHLFFDPDEFPGGIPGGTPQSEMPQGFIDDSSMACGAGTFGLRIQ